MSDDKTNRGGADRKRIDVGQDYECRHWAEKFGVSPDELKRAVMKVGPTRKIRGGSALADFMRRFVILLAVTFVLGAIAYGLGHYMQGKGIRTEADSKVTAQEQVENRELLSKPPAR